MPISSMFCTVQASISSKDYFGRIFRFDVRVDNGISNGIIIVITNKVPVFVDFINACDVRFDVRLLYLHIVVINNIGVASPIFFRNFYFRAMVIDSDGNLCCTVGVS